MKDLFKPVEYLPLEEEKSSPTPKQLDVEQIKQEMELFHSGVMQLVNEIERGYSSLRGPTQIKGSPIFIVIERMKYAPNKENIKNFFEIALQDLGAKFKSACEELFKKFPTLNKVLN